MVDKANRKKRSKADKGKAHKREREERVLRQAEAVRGKNVCQAPDWHGGNLENGLGSCRSGFA